MSYNLRPYNECGDCGYEWTPRGHNHSLKCPSCHSNDISSFRYEESDDDGLTLIGGVAFGVTSIFMLFLLGAGIHNGMVATQNVFKNGIEISLPGSSGYMNSMFQSRTY